MQLTRPMLFGATALALFAVLFTWYFYRFALDIGGAVPVAREEQVLDTASLRKPVVYVSVISRYPPNVISSGYQPMLDYMTHRSPYRFELKLCAEYGQAVDMLLRGEVAAAFLGSYLYITARRDHGVLPILKPLNSTGAPFSRSACSRVRPATSTTSARCAADGSRSRARSRTVRTGCCGACSRGTVWGWGIWPQSRTSRTTSG